MLRAKYVSDDEMDALDAPDNYRLPPAHPPETQRLIHDEARRALSRPASACAVCDRFKFLDEKRTEFGPNAGAVWHYYTPQLLLSSYTDQLTAPPEAPALDAELVRCYSVAEV
jgi:hypothetical protein